MQENFKYRAPEERRWSSCSALPHPFALTVTEHTDFFSEEMVSFEGSDFIKMTSPMVCKEWVGFDRSKFRKKGVLGEVQRTETERALSVLSAEVERGEV